MQLITAPIATPSIPIPLAANQRCLLYHMLILLNVIPGVILCPMALFVTSITGVKANLLGSSHLLAASDCPMTQFATFKTFVPLYGIGPFSQ